jgi:hypothetical protein
MQGTFIPESPLVSIQIALTGSTVTWLILG